MTFFGLHRGELAERQKHAARARVSISMTDFVDPYPEVQMRERVVERRPTLRSGTLTRCR
jgi:hypothetical protein